MRKLLRHADGLWPNLIAIAFVLGAYVVGWLGLLAQDWLVNGLATVLLAHAMVIAAYLVHECAHNTLFADNRHNARLGNVLMWINGACYGSYESVRHKHFRHHVDRADVVAFDYRARLARHPNLSRVLGALEWAYVPAVEILMHALVLVLPFTVPQRRAARGRVVIVLIVRVAIFTALVAMSPRVLLLYPVAYMLFLTVMRFMDAHQHTYVLFETLGRERGEEAQQFDRDFEQRNTFSNPLSMAHPWLNLLTLNFGYHNAHHERPTAPWYQLPGLHKELFGDDRSQVLPFRNLVRAYHRYRVPRMLNADEPYLDVQRDQGRTFIGVDGVSFLTAH